MRSGDVAEHLAAKRAFRMRLDAGFGAGCVHLFHSRDAIVVERRSGNVRHLGRVVLIAEHDAAKIAGPVFGVARGRAGRGDSVVMGEGAVVRAVAGADNRPLIVADGALVGGVAHRCAVRCRGVDLRLAVFAVFDRTDKAAAVNALMRVGAVVVGDHVAGEAVLQLRNVSGFRQAANRAGARFLADIGAGRGLGLGPFSRPGVRHIAVAGDISRRRGFGCCSVVSEELAAARAVPVSVVAVRRAGRGHRRDFAEDVAERAAGGEGVVGVVLAGAADAAVIVLRFVRAVRRLAVHGVGRAGVFNGEVVVRSGAVGTAAVDAKSAVGAVAVVAVCAGEVVAGCGINKLSRRQFVCCRRVGEVLAAGAALIVGDRAVVGAGWGNRRDVNELMAGGLGREDLRCADIAADGAGLVIGLAVFADRAGLCRLCRLADDVRPGVAFADLVLVVVGADFVVAGFAVRLPRTVVVGVGIEREDNAFSGCRVITAHIFEVAAAFRADPVFNITGVRAGRSSRFNMCRQRMREHIHIGRGRLCGKVSCVIILRVIRILERRRVGRNACCCAARFRRHGSRRGNSFGNDVRSVVRADCGRRHLSVVGLPHVGRRLPIVAKRIAIGERVRRAGFDLTAAGAGEEVFRRLCAGRFRIQRLFGNSFLCEVMTEHLRRFFFGVTADRAGMAVGTGGRAGRGIFRPCAVFAMVDAVQNLIAVMDSTVCAAVVGAGVAVGTVVVVSDRAGEVMTGRRDFISVFVVTANGAGPDLVAAGRAGRLDRLGQLHIMVFRLGVVRIVSANALVFRRADRGPGAPIVTKLRGVVPIFRRLAACAAIDVVTILFAKRIHRMIEDVVMVVRIEITIRKGMVVVALDRVAAGTAVPVFCLCSTGRNLIQRIVADGLFMEIMTERIGGSRIHVTAGLAGAGLGAAIQTGRVVRGPVVVGCFAGDRTAVLVTAVDALEGVCAVVVVTHSAAVIVVQLVAVSRFRCAADAAGPGLGALRKAGLMLRDLPVAEGVLTGRLGHSGISMVADGAYSVLFARRAASRGVFGPVAVGRFAGDGAAILGAAVDAQEAVRTIAVVFESAGVVVILLCNHRVKLLNLSRTRRVAEILLAAGAIPVFGITRGKAGRVIRRKVLQVGVVRRIDCNRFGSRCLAARAGEGLHAFRAAGRIRCNHAVIPRVVVVFRDRKCLFKVTNRAFMCLGTLFRAGRRNHAVPFAVLVVFFAVLDLGAVLNFTDGAATVQARPAMRLTCRLVVAICVNNKCTCIVVAERVTAFEGLAAVDAAAGAGLVIDRFVFAGRRRLKMVHAKGHFGRFDPVVTKLACGPGLGIGADRAGAALGTAMGTISGISGPRAEGAADRAVLDLGAVIHDTVGAAAVFAKPVVRAVAEAVDRTGIVVTLGGDRCMTAHPGLTSRTIDARRVADRFAGRRNRSTVFRRLMVASVRGAVSGVTMQTDCLIDAVRRAAGAVFCGIHRAVDTVGVAARALAVVSAGRNVLIGAAEVMTKRITVGEGFGRMIRAAAGAPFMIDRRVFAIGSRNQMVFADCCYPVMIERADAFRHSVAADSTVVIVRAAGGAGCGCGLDPFTVSTGCCAARHLCAVVHFTIGPAAVFAKPVVRTVVQFADRTGIVMSFGGDRLSIGSSTARISTMVGLDARRCTGRLRCNLAVIPCMVRVVRRQRVRLVQQRTERIGAVAERTVLITAKGPAGEVLAARGRRIADRLGGVIILRIGLVARKSIPRAGVGFHRQRAGIDRPLRIQGARCLRFICSVLLIEIVRKRTGSRDILRAAAVCSGVIAAERIARTGRKRYGSDLRRMIGITVILIRFVSVINSRRSAGSTLPIKCYSLLFFLPMGIEIQLIIIIDVRRGAIGVDIL